MQKKSVGKILSKSRGDGKCKRGPQNRTKQSRSNSNSVNSEVTGVSKTIERNQAKKPPLTPIDIGVKIQQGINKSSVVGGSKPKKSSLLLKKTPKAGGESIFLRGHSDSPSKDISDRKYSLLLKEYSKLRSYIQEQGIYKEKYTKIEYDWKDKKSEIKKMKSELIELKTQLTTLDNNKKDLKRQKDSDIQKIKEEFDLKIQEIKKENDQYIAEMKKKYKIDDDDLDKKNDTDDVKTLKKTIKSKDAEIETQKKRLEELKNNFQTLKKQEYLKKGEENNYDDKIYRYQNLLKAKNEEVEKIHVELNTFRQGAELLIKENERLNNQLKNIPSTETHAGNLQEEKTERNQIINEFSKKLDIYSKRIEEQQFENDRQKNQSVEEVMCRISSDYNTNTKLNALKASLIENTSNSKNLNQRTPQSQKQYISTEKNTQEKDYHNDYIREREPSQPSMQSQINNNQNIINLNNKITIHKQNQHEFESSPYMKTHDVPPSFIPAPSETNPDEFDQKAEKMFFTSKDLMQNIRHMKNKPCTNQSMNYPNYSTSRNPNHNTNDDQGNLQKVDFLSSTSRQIQQNLNTNHKSVQLENFDKKNFKTHDHLLLKHKNILSNLKIAKQDDFTSNGHYDNDDQKDPHFKTNDSRSEKPFKELEREYHQQYDQNYIDNNQNLIIENEPLQYHPNQGLKKSPENSGIIRNKAKSDQLKTSRYQNQLDQAYNQQQLYNNHMNYQQKNLLAVQHYDNSGYRYSQRIGGRAPNQNPNTSSKKCQLTNLTKNFFQGSQSNNNIANHNKNSLKNEQDSNPNYKNSRKIVAPNQQQLSASPQKPQIAPKMLSDTYLKKQGLKFKNSQSARDEQDMLVRHKIQQKEKADRLMSSNNNNQQGKVNNVKMNSDVYWTHEQLGHNHHPQNDINYQQVIADNIQNTEKFSKKSIKNGAVNHVNFNNDQNRQDNLSNSHQRGRSDCTKKPNNRNFIELSPESNTKQNPAEYLGMNNNMTPAQAQNFQDFNILVTHSTNLNSQNPSTSTKAISSANPNQVYYNTNNKYNGTRQWNNKYHTILDQIGKMKNEIDHFTEENNHMAAML